MARASNPELVELWRNRINEQVQSGRSVSEFCHLHGIKPYAFYFWRRKFFPTAEPIASQSGAALIPVRIVSKHPDSLARIQFASGVTLEAPVELMRVAIDQILVSERGLLGARSC